MCLTAAPCRLTCFVIPRAAELAPPRCEGAPVLRDHRERCRPRPPRVLSRRAPRRQRSRPLSWVWPSPLPWHGGSGPGEPRLGPGGRRSGCLGWGQRWFSLGREEGRKGARPAALELRRYPPAPVQPLGARAGAPGCGGLWRGGQGGSKPGALFRVDSRGKKYFEGRRGRTGPGERSLPGFGALLRGNNAAYSLCSVAVGKSSLPALFSLLVC